MKQKERKNKEILSELIKFSFFFNLNEKFWGEWSEKFSRYFELDCSCRDILLNVHKIF